MQEIAALTSSLHNFINTPPSKALIDKEFFELDSSILVQEQRIQEEGAASNLAKNIAYAFVPFDMSTQEYCEMKEFYATFRHGGGVRRAQHGLAVLADLFYKTSACLFRKHGDFDKAARAEAGRARYDFIRASARIVDNSQYVPFGADIEFYCITPWKHNELLAVSNRGTVFAIHPDGAYEVPELRLNDSIKSIMRTEGRWWLVGENARKVYEFNDQFALNGIYYPAPEGNPRVQTAPTRNGFALFPYNNTIWLYDRIWNHKKTLKLPHTDLASEPTSNGNVVYFRSANVFHQSSELLTVDDCGNINYICGGLDFAPKCSLVGSVCSWANRTSLYLLISTKTGIVNTMFSLETLNTLKPGSFAKGYDIIPCNNEYWMFFNLERNTNSGSQFAAMLRITKDTFRKLFV